MKASALLRAMVFVGGCAVAGGACGQKTTAERLGQTGGTGTLPRTTYVVTIQAASLAGLGACPDLGAVGLVAAPVDGGVSYSIYHCKKSMDGGGLSWVAITCDGDDSASVAYVPGSPQSLFVCADLKWTPVPLAAGEAGPPGPQGPQGPQGVPGVDGAPGQNGQDGATGAPGATSVVALSSFTGPGGPCANGGTEVQAGVDNNGDGMLEPSEVTTTAYVCNGAPGTLGPQGVPGPQGEAGTQGPSGPAGPQGTQGDAGPAGLTTLINVTPEPPGSNCAAGGQRIDVGIDTNGDGMLEGSEIQNTKYVCNGISGTSATPDAGGEAGDAPSQALGTISVTVANRPTQAANFNFIVAYQDGSGPWTIAPAPNGDTYSFTNNTGRYGVAWTCAVPGSAGVRKVSLTYSTVQEHASLTLSDLPAACTDRIPGAVPLTLSVPSPPVAESLIATFGAVTAIVSNIGGSATATMTTPPGTHDLVVFSTASGRVDADHALVVRGLEVGPNTVENVDFAGALPTQSAIVTVPSTGAIVNRTLLYAGGTVVTLVNETTSPFDTRWLASSEAQAGDVYDQQVSVTSGGQMSFMTNATATPGAITYVAPQSFTAAPPTVAVSAPYPQLSNTWSLYANAVGYEWSASQTQAAGTVTWSAQLSSGWIGMTPSFQMPDLSVLPGWSPQLQFVSGTQLTETLTAGTSTGGAADFPSVVPPLAGTQRTFVTSTFTLTP